MITLFLVLLGLLSLNVDSAAPKLIVFQRGNSLNGNSVANINQMVSVLNNAGTALSWDGTQTSNEGQLINLLNSGTYQVLLALNPNNGVAIWSAATQTAMQNAISNNKFQKMVVWDRFANVNPNVPDLNGLIFRDLVARICPVNVGVPPSTGPASAIEVGCWTGNYASHGSFAVVNFNALLIAHPEAQKLYRESGNQEPTHIQYRIGGVDIMYSGTPMDWYLNGVANQKAIHYFINSMDLLMQSGYECISSVADCADKDNGNYHSCAGCGEFAQCWGDGTQLAIQQCQPTLEYDAILDRCVWAGDSQTCNGRDPFVPPQDCDYNYAFVVDESGSIGAVNYPASIDFIISLIENNIGQSAKLSALAFNHNHDWIYHFTDSQSPRSGIINELTAEKNDFDYGGTNTKHAMETAIQEFKTNGFTTNNMLILITDGVGGDPCATSIINDLDNNNIRVVIVGIGNFNPAPVTCLVRGNLDDIITIIDFNFAPVVPQLQERRAICGSCLDYELCEPANTAINGFHYPQSCSCCRFMQCDQSGVAFDMPCGPGTRWSQAAHVCVHNYGECADDGCTLSPEAPPAAVAVQAIVNSAGNQIQNAPAVVEHKSNYYGYIMVIGVIAFILMNNVFIGCWCLGTGRNKAHAKFDMVPVSDEI